MKEHFLRSMRQNGIFPETGADHVTGTGDILFDENGIPLYDENEQIFMQDASGAEVGVFKAYTTVRDGEVEHPDGTITTEKQCVGDTMKPTSLLEPEPMCWWR